MRGDVVRNFHDPQSDKEVKGCLEFFYNDRVPDWGANKPGTFHLCQRHKEQYRFATLHDTQHRIAVYSAYRFQTVTDELKTDNNWFLEPQLVDQNWDGEMMDTMDLEALHKGVSLGEKQALDNDYKSSGYDRGHLSPRQHHSGVARQATFTLTNVVPQTRHLNGDVWDKYENELVKEFKKNKCDRAYMLVGAIPSDSSILTNTLKKEGRVNIPTHVWNAYCCVDQNGRPINSGGATAANTAKGSQLQRLTLQKLQEFLSTESPPQLFLNNCEA
ncbi:endonuclease domain-containing 1 protein-like [Conger conger]|uniref:endonuclease domain-containing 1 protein-like n=1 Tax=Conger conger TaxID=82655 RepID=UPI002A59CDEC|nr:endonuclease domain-containing 1 protein-like [Conger conger]